MMAAHSYLSSLYHIVLGICDLQNPHVYFLYEGKLELLEGYDNDSLDQKLLYYLSNAGNEKVIKVAPELLKAQPYEFALSIQLEEKYTATTHLIVTDTKAKALNNRQFLAINEARSNYLNNLERELLLKELEKQSEGLRLLNEINEREHIDLASKLKEGLKLTNQYFGLSGGIISTIREDIYEISYQFPDDLGFEIGQKILLKDTYCDIAASAHGPVAIDHMKASPYSSHQCYVNFGMESYIGAIYKAHEFKGSVSFSSKEVRKRPFSNYELEYIELFAKWIGNSIEADLKQQNLKEENHILYAFVRSSPAAIAMFDTDIKYLAASKKWKQDYGINRDVIGISHYDIFPEIGEDWKKIHRKALAGECIEKEEDKFIRGDGSVQWIQWDVRPWYKMNNEIGGIVMFTGDVSHFIMQRQNLSIAKLAAEKAGAVKEQFTYIASHDLQEPVRTITSLSQLFRKSYFDKLDMRGQKMLTYIESSANRMNLLIDGLLDFSRLGKNKALQLINLTDLVAEVKSDLNTQIKLKKAKIEVNELPTFLGYHMEIRLLMQNLISNAIKYAKPDAAPRIQITGKTEGLYHQIKVSDNGIGIPSSKYKKIFQIFQQLADRENQEGLGIGLANCYRIVEIHHGNIWVEANEAGGCDFYFTVFHHLDQLDLKV